MESKRILRVFSFEKLAWSFAYTNGKAGVYYVTLVPAACAV